jgi:hypothetical protein
MRAMSVPRAKTITTYFYPVGDDFRTVVEEWIIFLQPYLDSLTHYQPLTPSPARTPMSKG